VDLHSGGSPVERHGIYERRAPPAWCGSAEDGMGRLRSSGRNGGRMSLASEQPPPRRGQEEKIGGIGWAGEGRRGIWGFLESFRSDPTNAGAFSELGFFFWYIVCADYRFHFFLGRSIHVKVASSPTRLGPIAGSDVLKARCLEHALA
jgi:hypothetical protein